MLWSLTILSLVLWVVGLITGVQLGLWIHALLVLAIVSLLASLARSRV